MSFKGRSFITLLDYTPEEIKKLLDLSMRLKKEKYDGIPHKVLTDKNIVILFQKDSTRTRCAFEVGAMDLGMGVTYLGPNGSQMNKKESVADTARVLGRMYDGIEFRGYKQSDVETLAKYAGVPVWNGLTDMYHPTQILADFLTILEHKGTLEGVKFTYVGDARNNMGNSLMIGAAKMGMDFTALAPRSLWPDQELIDKCRQIGKETGAKLTFTEDVAEGTLNADVIYTDVWVSMGEPTEVWEKRVKLLADYQVDMQMIKNAKDDVIFMHCLPAFHDSQTDVGREMSSKLGRRYQKVATGEMEVTDEVFESEHSVVFQEAENRMHTIKAVMYATLK
ncbi:ornithine carbamoyltransferase [Mycoplasmatota bacterium zrk1]